MILLRGKPGDRRLRLRVEIEFGSLRLHMPIPKVHAPLCRLQRVVDPRSLSRDRSETSSTSLRVPVTWLSRWRRVWCVVVADLTCRRCCSKHARSPRRAGWTISNGSTADATKHCRSADEAFDLVTCRIAAHHFPDPRAFARETCRRPARRRSIGARRYCRARQPTRQLRAEFSPTPRACTMRLNDCAIRAGGRCPGSPSGTRGALQRLGWSSRRAAREDDGAAALGRARACGTCAELQRMRCGQGHRTALPRAARAGWPGALHASQGIVIAARAA